MNNQANQGQRICLKCGVPLAPGSAFCTACGAPAQNQATNQVQPQQARNVCVKCGVPLAPGSAFCTSCGTPAAKQQPAAQPQPQANVCPKCGVPLKPGSAFCTSCGFKIGGGAAPVNATPGKPTPEQEQMLKRQYFQAVRLLETKQFDQALQIFKSLGDYSDSKAKAQQCMEEKESTRKEQIYSSAVALLSAKGLVEANVKATIENLKTIPDYKDSKELIPKLEQRLKEHLAATEAARKEFAYNQAVAILSAQMVTDVQLKQAIESFKSLKGYKEADKKLPEAEERLDKWLKEKAAAEEAERIRIAKQKAKTKKIIIISVIAFVIVALVAAGLIVGNIKHDISYELIGGFNNNNPENYKLLSGDIVLNKPTKEGYTFVGWIGTDLDAPTLDVTIKGWSWGDREYTAVWTPNVYNIVLNENGGLEMGDVQAVYDEAYIIPGATWPGHYFEGWFVNDQRFDAVGTYVYANDLELIAKWDAIKYNIYYDLQGGTNSDDNPSYYITDEEVTLASPTRRGYTFLGWTSEDQTTPVIDLKIPVGSLESKTFIANWEANTYTIKFDSNGGSSVADQSVTFDGTFTLPTPTKTGYTFKGWYNYETKVTDGRWTNAADVTLSAKWTPNTYTVSFDANDGSVNSSSMSVTYDAAYTLPTPTRTGYSFAGWYNGNTSVATNGTWKTTSNVTLTAAWTAKSYTLTLDANGGTVSSSTFTVTYDAAYTLPTPTKTGYTFNGWYNNGTYIDDGVWEYDAALTLTANWTANTYSVKHEGLYVDTTVKFDYNNGYGDYYDETLSPGETLYYPSIPQRSGYVFTGWYTDADCTSKYTFTENITGDMTLYAGWTEMSMSNAYSEFQVDPTDYTSSYSERYVNSSSSSSSNQIYIYLVANETGTHTINYRSSSSSYYYAQNIGITNITQNETILATNLCDYTYYQSVSFDCNEGDIIVINMYNNYYTGYYAYFYFSGFSEPTSTAVNTNCTSTVTYGSSFELPTPEKTGYTFDGWYVGDTKIESDTWNYAEDVTLTAGWNANEYTLTFSANGGTLDTESMTVTYDDTYTLPVPTRTGYTFVGWYSQGEYIEDGTWTYSSDKDLTAVWEANRYALKHEEGYLDTTVTIDYNYTDGYSYTVELDVDNTLSYPGIPSRSGYVFTGWYTDAECTTRYTFSEDITGDFTLYAGWVEHTTTNVNYTYNIIPSNYTALNNNSYRVYVSASEDSQNYYYFVANETGEHKVYFKNEYSSSSYAIYIGITNVTTGEVIRETAGYSSTNYASVSFECDEGDVIVINAYCYYGSYLSLYFDGFNAITSTATNKNCTQYVSYDSDFTLPTPEKTGYTFGGWYNGETLIEEGVWNYTTDLELTPKWTANSYTITLDGNGYTLDETTIDINYDEEYTLPDLTRTGYTFNGWFDGTTKVESGTWTYTSDLSLTASWTADNYTLTLKDVDKSSVTVTYDYNYEGSTSTKVTLYNEDVLGYPTVPSRSGYVFTGWYTDAECTTRYDFTGAILDDMTLYAGWIAQYENAYNSYILNASYYNTTNSNVYSVDTSYTSSSSQIYVYLLANESGTHQIYYANNYSGTSYATYVGITNLTTGETIKETSYWNSTYYNSISFECNAGDVIAINCYLYSYGSYLKMYFDGFTSITSTAYGFGYEYREDTKYQASIDYDDEFVLPTPTRTGYTFNGWYNGDTKVESGTWNFTSDVELTASWTVNEYTLTLDADGGTVDYSTADIEYGENYTLPTPTKTGYTFNGWYNGDDLFTEGTWNYTSDIEIKASWTANSYTLTYSDVTSSTATVTFNYNYSGSSSNSVVLYSNETLTYPTLPTRSGYMFTGWYTDSECTTEYDFTGTISGDITLYAGWTQMSVTYYTNRTQIDPSKYTSSNAYSQYNNANSSNQNYIYLVATETGTHTISHYNNSGSNYYRNYVGITNLTTGESIQSESLYSGYSTTTHTFECNEGDVILINTYNYYYSTYIYFYFDGFNSVESSAVCNAYDYYEDGSITLNVTYGTSFTLPTPTREGYTFDGWYYNGTKVESGNWDYDSDVTLTASWTAN